MQNQFLPYDTYLTALWVCYFIYLIYWVIYWSFDPFLKLCEFLSAFLRDLSSSLQMPNYFVCFFLFHGLYFCSCASKLSHSSYSSYKKNALSWNRCIILISRVIIIGQCEIVVVYIGGRGWEGIYVGISWKGWGFSAVMEWISIPQSAADNVKSECLCKCVCICVLSVCTLQGIIWRCARFGIFICI